MIKFRNCVCVWEFGFSFPPAIHIVGWWVMFSYVRPRIQHQVVRVHFAWIPSSSSHIDKDTNLVFPEWKKKKGRSFVPKLFPRLLLYIWCGQHELHSILLRWLRCVYVHILGMSNTHVTSGKPISQTKYQSRDSVHHGIQSHILFTS